MEEKTLQEVLEDGEHTLNKREIQIKGEFLRACSWCEEEDAQYKADVRMLASSFKRRITHGICRAHFNQQSECLKTPK